MSCCDGFRLPAASECSIRSKARIDALFEDSRSVCSSSFAGIGPWTSVQDVEGCCAGDEDQRRVNSAVQARIEAMFASVEAESAAPGECAAAVLPVKYMGAAPVGGRVASVRGLQEPLRQLVERIGKSVSAELEVSRRGLTFRTSELHEKNNPFRRIAVWSALKLQTRRRQSKSNSQEPLHAFVPLVADDRPTGPSSSLSNGNVDDRHADLYRTMRGLAKDVENYPPIFAVVMRRPGAARLLECHAFACRCEEDAIAAAATLYRALLADLEATARRPRQKNGLGCVSLASVASSVRESSPRSRRRTSLDLMSNRTDVVSESSATATQALPPPPLPPPPPPPPLPLVSNQPTRPPRVKKNSISGSSVNTESDNGSSASIVNIVDKVQHPLKKNSDVKAEDVLEARSRMLYAPLRDPCVNESSAVSRRKESNSSSESSSNFEQTNEERRMNAKNKIYGRRDADNLVSLDDVQVIEKIYNREKERTSSDRERSNSYDFNCCTDNSIYESTREYSKAHVPCTKSKNEVIYEVTRRSGHSTPSNHKSKSNSSFGRPQAQVSNKCEESCYAERPRRNSSATRHEDHFRDVDKIYCLDSDDACMSKSSRDPRIYDVASSNRQAASIRSSNSACSNTRLNRVSTMDRPIRRPSVEPPQPPSLSQIPSHRSQESESRERRRSRAGSEPPVSRTDAAVAVAASAAAMLKRSQSDLELDRGDLMTRVELPRRGSFLKPGSVRNRDGIEGGGGGTPLGFTELFDEFRNQEGLTSIDDILAAIIDPEGMSFNDLKPLYKEFLLKLAGTLTQDELYQRSASIMRRRRGRPQRRRSSRSNAGIGSGRPNLLRRAIKRSVSRLRSSTSAPTEFTSVIFPASRFKERSSCGSSSSCDVAKGGRYEGCSSSTSRGYCNQSSNKNNRVLASKLGRRRSSTRCSSSKSRIGHTTSEDSDTCRRFASGGGTMAAANRSSSGYVSCSECSYDSESCTCVSADKCYCSLSRRSPQGTNEAIVMQEHRNPAMPCSCDTDSCSESNKCYCARKPTILEQLRQKGIVPSESTLSRGASPDRSKSTRTSKSLATSKSIEYFKIRSSSVRGSSEHLALDYDLFSPGYRRNQPHSSNSRRSSQCSSASEKVLVVSARDPQGRLIYVGGSTREARSRSSRYCRSVKHDQQPTGHHEALSIKKSAEIAAVFGGHARTGRRASSTSSLRSSISLEAGLGYLP